VCVHGASYRLSTVALTVVTLPVTLSADERLCVVCCESLEGRRSHATTCSPACRKAKSRGHTAPRLRGERVTTWALAAASVDYRLADWIVRSLDLAAKDLLDGERRLAERIGQPPA